MNKKLFDFIEKSPTPFHAVRNVCETLKEKGYYYIEIWAEYEGADTKLVLFPRRKESIE